MMNKNQKVNYIKEMKNSFETNESVLVTHYQGLTMKELDELRSEMRKHGVLFKITKNRITKLALKDTKCKEITDLFSGPTAVAFSKDAISSAKILAKFSKNNENLRILGGIMGNELLKSEDIKRTLSTYNGYILCTGLYGRKTEWSHSTMVSKITHDTLMYVKNRMKPPNYG